MPLIDPDNSDSELCSTAKFSVSADELGRSACGMERISSGRRLGWWRSVTEGAVFYGITSFIVLLGGSFALGTLAHTSAKDAQSNDWTDHFVRWDGDYYLEIARAGYSYDPNMPSSVAFFPLYPLTSRGIAWCTGLRHELALLVAAHMFLVGAFIVLALYVRQPQECGDRRVVGFTLLAFGLFPPSFFFRMAYSESCFLFFVVLSMLAMKRRWPLTVIALLIGAGTATRPVGVAMIPIFVLHLRECTTSWAGFMRKALLLLPLAVSGLGAFTVYQYFAFGDPLAFAKSQHQFRLRSPASSGSKALALLSHEPIWSAYDPESVAHWRRVEPFAGPWLNLAFANPIFFLGAAVLVMVGVGKRWLNSRESLLAGLLLLIPYVTRSYEMCMASQARYAAAAFPIYLVLGRALDNILAPCATALLCVSAFYLGAYTALFAAGHLLI